jgi:superfamily II DNA or RNA helicase
MPATLRPYQRQLKHDVYAEWNAGRQNVMAVSATGSGKTVFFSDIINDESGGSVAIAHRQELVSQISLALARNGIRHRVIGSDTLRRACSRIHVEDEQCGYDYVDQRARVAAAGVDTLVRLEPTDPVFVNARLWVGDEGHHFLAANKWGKAVALMNPIARGLLVTATPIRADGKGLGRHVDGLADSMVQAPSMRDLINMGYLTDYRIFAPPSALQFTDEDISASTGDFNQDTLRKKTKAAHITGDIVGHYLRWAPGKLGVTFAVDVEAATEIAQAFKAAGVPAEVVSAKTPDALRANILRRFKRREILQLVNVDLFGEGFDLPAIEVVSMARATASFSLFAQQFGRALRLMIAPDLGRQWDGFTDDQRRAHIASSGKPRAIIIDHVSNVVRHGGPPDKRITWSLDRREKRSGSNVSDAIPMRNCLNPECVNPYKRIYPCCPYCGTYPEPAARSAPEFVDGDLIELDDVTLARMRGEIARVDAAPVIPYGMTDPAAIGGVKKNHWLRQQAQVELRKSLAWWSGLENAKGRTDIQEQYRRFYFMFGVDVATAQTLRTKDAEELRQRIVAQTARDGIDATLNF